MKTVLKTIAVVVSAVAAVTVSAAECDMRKLYRESRLAQAERESVQFELRAMRAEIALLHPAHREEIYRSPISLPTSEYLYDASAADQHAYSLTCDPKFLRAAKLQIGIARTTELVRLMRFDRTSKVIGS